MGRNKAGWARRAYAAVDVTSLGQQHSTPKKLLHSIKHSPLTPSSTSYRTSPSHATLNKLPNPQWPRP